MMATFWRPGDVKSGGSRTGVTKTMSMSDVGAMCQLSVHLFTAACSDLTFDLLIANLFSVLSLTWFLPIVRTLVSIKLPPWPRHFICPL